MEIMENKLEESIVALLYTLIRDCVPPGVIEPMVQDIEKHKEKENVYSNKFIEGYSRDILKRLK